VKIVTRGQAKAPIALIEHGCRRRIVSVQDSWRIDDEWWRNPISRHYYQVMVDDDSLRTVYRDLTDDVWWAQNY